MHLGSGDRADSGAAAAAAATVSTVVAAARVRAGGSQVVAGAAAAHRLGVAGSVGTAHLGGGAAGIHITMRSACVVTTVPVVRCSVAWGRSQEKVSAVVVASAGGGVVGDASETFVHMFGTR